MSKDEHFGQVLRRRRRERELNLKDVAEELQVSVVFVSEVERGAKPPLTAPAIDALRNLLGDVSELHRAAEKSRNVVQLDLRNASPTQRRLATKLARHWSSMGPQLEVRLEQFFDSVESDGEGGR